MTDREKTAHPTDWTILPKRDPWREAYERLQAEDTYVHSAHINIPPPSAERYLIDRTPRKPPPASPWSRYGGPIKPDTGPDGGYWFKPLYFLFLGVGIGGMIVGGILALLGIIH